MLKPVLKWTGLTIGGLLVLIVLVGLFLVTPPGKDLVKGIVESQVSSLLGAEVSIADLSTNFTGYLRLDSIIVLNPDSEDTALFVGSVYTEYSAWSFLGGPFEIDSVGVVDVRGAVVRTESGEVLLPIALPDSSESPSDDHSTPAESASSEPAFTLRTAVVQKVNLFYADYVQAIRANVRDASIMASMPDGRTTSFSLNADPIDVGVNSVALPSLSLHLEGDIDADAAGIDRLTLVTDSLETTITGRVPFDGAAEISAEVSMTGNPNPLLSPLAAAYGFSLFRTSDDLRLTASVSGRMTRPAIAARLALSEVEAYETTIDDALMVVSLAGDTLFADTLNAKIFGGRVNASAIARLDDIYESTARATFNDIKLATMYTALTGESSPYKGKLSGNVTITELDSNFVNWRTALTFTGAELAYHEKSLPDLTGGLTFKSGDLHVAIEQEELHVLADANIGDRLSGEFDAHIPSLAPFGDLVDIPQLKGRLSAKGSLGGSIENPAIAAEVSGAKLVYANVPIDTIYSQFQYADSTITIDTVYVQSSGDSIDPLRPPFEVDSLSGHYSFEASGSGTLEDMNAYALVNLRSFTYQQYALDSALLVVTLKGRTAHLDSTRLYLDSLAVHLGGQVNVDSLSGRIVADITDQAKSDSTETDSTTTHPRAGRIEASFTYSDTAESSATVTGDNLSMATIIRLSGAEQDIDGRIEFDIEAGGTLERPHGNIRAKIGSLRYSGILLDSVVVRAGLEDTVVTLDTLRAYGSDQHLDMRSRLALDRDSTGLLAFSELKAFQGSARSDSISLTLLEPMLPEGMTIAGRASADMTWDGTVGEPNVRGRFDLRDVNFVPQPQLDSITGFTLALTTEDRRIVIDTGYGRYNNMPFTLKGTASLVDWERLDTDLRLNSQGFGQLRADGTIGADDMDMNVTIDTLSLGIFEPFVPMVDTFDGSLSCQLTLRGSPGNPEINGNLLSRNLTVKPTLMDSTIHNGLVRITFSGNEITVDSIYATLGKGWMLLNGTVAVEDQTVSSIDLAFTSNDITFSAENLCIVTIDSTRLTYRTTSDGYLLSGRLELGESRLTKDFPIEAILPWAKSVEAVPPDYPEMLKKTSLDIQVRESSKLWVDNNLAKIRMHVALAVVGTVARPTASGQVTIEEGYLSYLDRKFDVTKGSFLMSNPNRFNPEINLQAETDVTEWVRTTGTTYHITMAVTGPLDQLQNSLTSNPPLDEPNIVSLLTLGVTRDQLTSNGGSGTGDVLTNRATSLTVNRITGYASRQVESALGLEEFSVQGNLLDPNQRGNTRLRATKRLSDRVSVTYMSTVGSANEQAIRVEYRWTDHISLLGQTDREGKAVLNIKYGLRFK